MSYQAVLSYFNTITTIPRPSGHEEHIRKWLIKRSNSHNFKHIVDTVGNLIMYVPASPGFEKLPSVILQAHMDMVCVAAAGVEHDFFVDALEIYIKEEWMYARNTTLGADNGMAIAMILAAVEENKHGALELLFTIDEERGLTGALEGDTSLLHSSLMINLDTEDEGEICISSAGGVRLDSKKTINRQTIKDSMNTYILSLQGLTGGHSGAEIHLSRGNAIRLMSEILLDYTGQLELIDIRGGTADNAIPGHCTATVAVDNHDTFITRTNQIVGYIQTNYDEPDAHITITHHQDNMGSIIGRRDFLTTILSVPNGVQALSPSIDGLVQTSLNHGIINTTNKEFVCTHSIRSSISQDRDTLKNNVQKIYQQALRISTDRSPYPGREEDPQGSFVQHTKKIYEQVLGNTVNLVAYHAGLECGALVGKFDRHVQCVSFGPTIKDPHSPQERVHLPSVQRIYQVVLNLLEDLAN